MHLNLDQAAAALGKTARQVRYLIEQGKLPAEKTQGRWRIDSTHLPRSEGQQQARNQQRERLRDVVEEVLEIPEKRVRYSVRQIKAFAIGLPLYQETQQHLSESHPATCHLRQMLEQLATGCHRYERRDKLEAYRQARDAASLAVCALILVGDEPTEGLRAQIENELMPAIAGLLRRIDRQSHQR